ncbi:putative D-lactate dehydrogenase [Smittium mucronatum]|uniref:Putative D-lactate dehydrogenase n=1 Tax=Smittium mucronatum TaxID=133383 RepID=A0A1R0H2K2_9FUNG|nr:putative D-lactate dehydrogenase [Smittium mucronatum]
MYTSITRPLSRFGWASRKSSVMLALPKQFRLSPTRTRAILLPSTNFNMLTRFASSEKKRLEIKPRNPQYKKASILHFILFILIPVGSADVAFFRSVLGDGREVIAGTEIDGIDTASHSRMGTEEADLLLQQHNTSWNSEYRGNGRVLLFPTSAAQISRILKYCNENRIAVVPQGGGSGVQG